jgi:hypothetical protein
MSSGGIKIIGSTSPFTQGSFAPFSCLCFFIFVLLNISPAKNFKFN